jgi:large subunit ribosomal protein L17
MKHRIKGRKLGRTASHRAALMSALATSLLKHKRIKTTLAKAKEARGYVEDIITKARKGGLHQQRLVMEKIHDHEVVKELFAEIVSKVGDRPGGFTRVVKLGNRKGDAASMAILELVDYNDIANQKAEEKKEAREAKRESKREKESNKNVEDAKIVEKSKL